MTVSIAKSNFHGSAEIWTVQNIKGEQCQQFIYLYLDCSASLCSAVTAFSIVSIHTHLYSCLYHLDCRNTLVFIILAGDILLFLLSWLQTYSCHYHLDCRHTLVFIILTADILLSLSLWQQICVYILCKWSTLRLHTPIKVWYFTHILAFFYPLTTCNYSSRTKILTVRS